MENEERESRKRKREERAIGPGCWCFTAMMIEDEANSVSVLTGKILNSVDGRLLVQDDFSLQF